MYTLDEKNEDKQNDAVNEALENHMAIKERMEAFCVDEEKKFYRGENSSIEKCNFSCITANIERQIVSYVSAMI